MFWVSLGSCYNTNKVPELTTLPELLRAPRLASCLTLLDARMTGIQTPYPAMITALKQTYQIDHKTHNQKQRGMGVSITEIITDTSNREMTEATEFSNNLESHQASKMMTAPLKVNCSVVSLGCLLSRENIMPR